MGARSGLVAQLCVIFALYNVAQCTEFVPVYSWTTSPSAEKVPALQKISHDSFKDYILEQQKSDPFIVVFAEQTLSPEDFAQKDAQGRTAFKQLSQLKSTATVTYRPYVQNPIRAFKHLVKESQEVSIESIKSNLVIPKTRLLIVNLNDAKDDEERRDLLSRHDSNIQTIYNKIVEEHDNVVAYYTAYHTSWVPSEPTETRQRRSLLATVKDDPKPNNKDNVTIYLTGPANFTYNDNTTPITLAFEITNKDNIITLTAKVNATDNVVLPFRLTDFGYVQLEGATIGNEAIYNAADVHMPEGFSYHCSSLELRTKTTTLVIPGFQIQPFTSSERFDDAYDCVGFTSAPIWSGLFVTFILLFIMTIGLTMMMDIRTMDRFDDAKGKTITINASD